MKISLLKAATLVVATFACSTLLMAQDGAGEQVFKSKCAMCHGQTGEGKSGPALKGTKLSEDDVLLVITKGAEGKKAPHSKPVNGLSDEQAKAVAHYVKSLK